MEGGFMYQTDYLFTNAISHKESNTLRVSLFLDEDFKPYRVPSFQHWTKQKNTLAHFNVGDVPIGEYRFVPANLGLGYGHIHKDLGLVIVQNEPTIYLMQDAPQKGYYVQLDIKIDTSVNTLQIDNNTTISMNASEIEQPIIDLNFIGGQYLDEPHNRELTDDELFQLNVRLSQQEWWDMATNYYLVYHSFLPFVYNPDVLDGLLNTNQ